MVRVRVRDRLLVRDGGRGLVLVPVLGAGVLSILIVHSSRGQDGVLYPQRFLLYSSFRRSSRLRSSLSNASGEYGRYLRKGSSRPWIPNYLRYLKVVQKPMASRPA